MKLFNKVKNKSCVEKFDEDNIFDAQLKSLQSQVRDCRISLEASVERVIVKQNVITLYPDNSNSSVVLLAKDDLDRAKNELVELLENYETATKNYYGFLMLHKNNLNTTRNYVCNYLKGSEVVESTYKYFYRKLAKY